MAITNYLDKPFHKEAALKIMREGFKVTHKYFSVHEWMFINKDGLIEFEDGVICTVKAFYADRTAAGWNDGYTLYLK